MSAVSLSETMRFFNSFFKLDSRVITRIGNSYGVTLSRDYVDMLLRLRTGELTQYYIGNYVILSPSRISEIQRDLTRVVMRCLELLCSLEDDEQRRKKIKEAYDSVANL